MTSTKTSHNPLSAARSGFLGNPRGGTGRVNPFPSRPELSLSSAGFFGSLSCIEMFVFLFVCLCLLINIFPFVVSFVIFSLSIFINLFNNHKKSKTKQVLDLFFAFSLSRCFVSFFSFHILKLSLENKSCHFYFFKFPFFLFSFFFSDLFVCFLHFSCHFISCILCFSFSPRQVALHVVSRGSATSRSVPDVKRTVLLRAKDNPWAPK